MRVTRLIATLCVSMLLSSITTSPAVAAPSLIATFPPGSDVLIGYFYVEWAPEDVWLEAWNADGISTVRVALRTPVPNLVQFDEVSGPGLLTVAEDRSAATIDAVLPKFGHLQVDFRWLGGGLGFQKSGNLGGFSYHLISPSGQLTSEYYTWSATMGDRTFGDALDSVFGRDLTGFSSRTPI